MRPRRPATYPSSVMRALVEREMPISHESCWGVENSGRGQPENCRGALLHELEARGLARHSVYPPQAWVREHRVMLLFDESPRGYTLLQMLTHELNLCHSGDHRLICIHNRIPGIHSPGGKMTERFGIPNRTIQEMIHIKVMLKEITSRL